MTQTAPRWTARAFLGRAFGMIRGNFKIFILIVLLWAFLPALVVMGIQEDGRDLMTMSEDMFRSGEPSRRQLEEFRDRAVEDMNRALMSEEEKFIADFIRILLIAIVTALLSTATFLVWARAIGVGRGNVLESGTIGRFAMILWRQVSLIGYMLPIFIAVAIVNYMFLLFLIRILGIQGGGLAVASVLVYLLTLALILLVLVGFAISVAATAVDDRRGIMASLQAIKGRTAAPLMAGGAILVGLVIVTLLVSAIMTGLFGGQVLSTLALIVLITLYSMFMLTLVALGRAVYEQIVNSTASGPAQT